MMDSVAVGAGAYVQGVEGSSEASPQVNSYRNLLFSERELPRKAPGGWKRSAGRQGGRSTGWAPEWQVNGAGGFQKQEDG